MRRLLILATALFLVSTACQSSDDDVAVSTTAPTSTGEDAGTDDADDAVGDGTDDAVEGGADEGGADDTESPEPADPSDGEATCPPAEGAAERTTVFETEPPFCIDPESTITAVIETSRGSFTVELFPDRAPITVNSFVFLARNRFYEGVAFHRIIPGFVIQGGDAVGDPPGTGGPGYTFIDELPLEGEYEVGSVAMANAGPDTNGSQFFVVTGDNGVALPPRWALFGRVTEGLDVVLDIESTGTDSGTPLEETVMLSVTITEG